MVKAIVFISFLVTLVVGIVALVVLYFMFPTASPIKSVTYFIDNTTKPHIMMSSQTMAFIPFWRLEDSEYARFDLLTEINYFSLSVNGSGNFIELIDGNAEPGWHSWNKDIVRNLIAKTQIKGGKFTFTVLMHDNNTIETFLDNKQAQQNLTDNIIEQINSRRLNGVVIDFEYTGEPDPVYRQTFTSFAASLSQALRKNNSGTSLSIAILPLEGRRQGLFDLQKLVPLFDRFIGMSYEYYSANSEIAGPVAPMNGFKENKFFFDVSTTYEDYLKIIPKEKILMGIPYYGWDWTVKDGKKIQSATYPPSSPLKYSAILSYGRMRENEDLVPEQCQWDELALSPWCWYIDKDDTHHQVWFEDNNSIGIKYDYAKKMGFAGIAIWVLGYDKDYPDLWDIMKETFGQK